LDKSSELRRCIIVSGKPEFFQMDLPKRKRMLDRQEHRDSYQEAPGVSLEILQFLPATTRIEPGKLQASAWRSFTFCLSTLFAVTRSEVRKQSYTGLRPLASISFDSSEVENELRSPTWLAPF